MNHCQTPSCKYVLHINGSVWLLLIMFGGCANAVPPYQKLCTRVTQFGRSQASTRPSAMPSLHLEEPPTWSRYPLCQVSYLALEAADLYTQLWPKQLWFWALLFTPLVSVLCKWCNYSVKPQACHYSNTMPLVFSTTTASSKLPDHIIWQKPFLWMTWVTPRLHRWRFNLTNRDLATTPRNLTIRTTVPLWQPLIWQTFLRLGLQYIALPCRDKIDPRDAAMRHGAQWGNVTLWVTLQIN